MFHVMQNTNHVILYNWLVLYIKVLRYNNIGAHPFMKWMLFLELQIFKNKKKLFVLNNQCRIVD